MQPDVASHLKQVSTCLLWAACKEGQDGHQTTYWMYQDPLGKEARSPKDNQPAPDNHKSTSEPLPTVAGINNRCFLVHIFWCQTIISTWDFSDFKQCQTAMWHNVTKNKLKAKAPSADHFTVYKVLETGFTYWEQIHSQWHACFAFPSTVSAGTVVDILHHTKGSRHDHLHLEAKPLYCILPRGQECSITCCKGHGVVQSFSWQGFHQVDLPWLWKSLKHSAQLKLTPVHKDYKNQSSSILNCLWPIAVSQKRKTKLVSKQQHTEIIQIIWLSWQIRKMKTIQRTLGISNQDSAKSEENPLIHQILSLMLSFSSQCYKHILCILLFQNYSILHLTHPKQEKQNANPLRSFWWPQPTIAGFHLYSSLR